MNEQQEHPTQELLAAYSRGELADADDGKIEDHLQECDRCCDTLNSLPEDTLIASLRSDPGDLTVPSLEAIEADNASIAGEPPLSDHPRYRIIDWVGEGGMGTVYRAEHRMMRRQVAIKVINPRLVNRPGTVDRFHREMQVAARLSHPNIVTSFDAEQVDGLHFLVMEFVEGTDLASVVKQRGPLPVEEACDYVRQAAIALQHANEQGMVHRDIKPDNLMLVNPQHGVDARPVIKVLDFGLASLFGDAAASVETSAEQHEQTVETGQLTLAGSMMGTPDFMSPEQADDARTADTRSDIYSLGATLYFLLAGRPPFSGTIHEILGAHRDREPKPMETLRADLPSEVADIVGRMMAKNRADRFATPSQVAEALKPFIGQPGAHSTRRKLTLWLAAAAAMLLCVATALAVAFYAAPGGTTPTVQPRLVRQFQQADETISQDGIAPELDGWCVDVSGPRTVRLFELPVSDIEDCTLLYQAMLKTKLDDGTAYLEMLCHFPGRGDAFSRFGQQSPLTGTTNWVSRETPMYVMKGQTTDVVRLNLIVSGTGTVWIKDVAVRTAPSPNMSFFQPTTPGGNIFDLFRQ